MRVFHNNKTRWFLTVILILLVILGVTRQLDTRAAPPINEAFERALVTFAVVRGINAVISVVQGTELAVEPAGIGVVLTPGEVFDPVNDLIERFSWIMLLASTSLGAQKVMLGIGSAWELQVVIVAAASVLLAYLWRPGWFAQSWRGIAIRLAVLVLFVRFAAAVMVVLNQTVYDAFLDAQYQLSYQALEQTRDEVEALQAAEQQPDESGDETGFLGRLSRWYDRTTQSFDVDARIAEYRQRFARASEHIVHLIVVFLLQTVLFPLLILWLGVRLVGVIVRINGN